jgi:hypothetical protein
LSVLWPSQIKKISPEKDESEVEILTSRTAGIKENV